MPTRRNILLNAAAFALVGTAGAKLAYALSSEPMAPEDLSALALACGNQTRHTQLISDARLLLDDAIKSGMKPAGTTETVVCPFCRCAFQVTPDIGFQ
ncbi:MAG: hypothetical protein HYU58_05270 [Proteobacteria bacterium]|nr:hypothetical protein [Pseudomonadota bacterium]